MKLFDVRALSLSFAVTLSAAASAFAGFSHTNPAITAPGGFVQAGASSVAPGSVPLGGSDLFNFFSSGQETEQSFTGLGSAFTAASYSNAVGSGNAWAYASMGVIKVFAQNSAANNSAFAQTDAHAGFKETLTINNAALTGQAGIAQFNIHVTGNLDAAGFAGRTLFALNAYKNNTELDIYNGLNAYINKGNSTPISTDRQRFQWELATYGTPPTDSDIIDDTVTIAVPFTYGTSFTLAIYGVGHAGMRSSSGVPGSSSATLDFSHTAGWGGVENIYLSNGQLVSSYQITSASGLNYQFAIIPEPASLSLLALTGLMFIRRR
jgi:hypothetical protein